MRGYVAPHVLLKKKLQISPSVDQGTLWDRPDRALSKVDQVINGDVLFCYRRIVALG